MSKRMLLLLFVLLLPTELAAETLRVKSRTRVWYGPGQVTRVIGSLPAGKVLESLGRSGEWWKVQLPDGEVGFIPAAVVEVVASAEPAGRAQAPAPAAPAAPARPEAPPMPTAPPVRATPPRPAPPAAPSPRAVTPAPHAQAPASHAAHAPAETRTRFKVLVGGGYQLGTQAFTQTISFNQFLEKATIATSYTADRAPGLDVGIQFNAFKHVGFSAAATLYNRDLAGSYSASFPHPLYFDHARTATGSVSGKQKETAGHVNLVVFGASGSLDLSAWTGVSFFKVDADVLENVVYSQSYPYDSVTVTSAPQTKASDSPIGFNVGASADWRFARNIGFGIQGRYARAKAKFAVTNAPTAEVDAGGFQAGAGIRFYF